MAVIAIAGDHLITLLGRELHADDDRFLADIEVAEPADQPHAVHLARLLLETADQQHVAAAHSSSSSLVNSAIFPAPRLGRLGPAPFPAAGLVLSAV